MDFIKSHRKLLGAAAALASLILYFTGHAGFAYWPLWASWAVLIIT